jgi:hypothetical protein
VEEALTGLMCTAAQEQSVAAEEVDPNDFRIPAGGTATATVTLSSPLKLGKSTEILPASPNGIANSARPEFVKAKVGFSGMAFDRLLGPLLACFK